MLGRPARAGGDLRLILLQQAAVFPIPIGQFHPRKRRKAGPQPLVRRVERGQPQIPWLAQRLARVNHIIHLAVILLGGGVDVLLGCLPTVKAVDVALAHVPFRLPLAMRHPFSNALAHPTRMGNP